MSAPSSHFPLPDRAQIQHLGKKHRTQVLAVLTTAAPAPSQLLGDPVPAASR
jgi:hypothetical protein